MDPAEHLPWFVDEPGRALAQAAEGGTAGPVDRRQPKHLQRHASLQPGPFAGQPGLATPQAWGGGAGFIHPTAPLVAVDTGGGEVSHPGQGQSG